MAEGGDGTVGKALEVLDMVASAGRPMRFSEMLPLSGLPKATLYRHCRKLVDERMLALDPETGRYALGVRLVRLAHAAWSQSSIAPIARSEVIELVGRTGLEVRVAQLEDGRVLFVDKVAAGGGADLYGAAGRVAPAWCTAEGKAMLAYLPPEALEAALAEQSFRRRGPNGADGPETLRAMLVAARAEGHAVEDEELAPGALAVAVPILSRRGTVLGALSLAGTAPGAALGRLVALAPGLRASAARIAAEVEAWRFPEGEVRLAGE